jgi:NAD(P)-dependent dehydrogenase (short-subunit alcohol dehydrogenase family)
MQNTNITNNKKTWFITGASKGFGLSLVKQLLATGQNVAATSRNLAELVIAVGSTADNFLPLEVDLTNEEVWAALCIKPKKPLGA